MCCLYFGPLTKNRKSFQTAEVARASRGARAPPTHTYSGVSRHGGGEEGAGNCLAAASDTRESHSDQGQLCPGVDVAD